LGRVRRQDVAEAAFMDLDDGINRSREEHINMNNREQVR
jgi:hypothetical protein